MYVCDEPGEERKERDRAGGVVAGGEEAPPPLSTGPGISNHDKEVIREILNMKEGDDMSDGQYYVIKVIYLHMVLPNERHASRDPLNLLLLGGPGTGKTHIMTVFESMHGNPTIYVAVGGSAASNLPGGKTICNLFGFVPTIASKNPASRKKLPPMTTQSDQQKLLFLQKVFEQCKGTLVVDEVSMMGALYLTHIHHRMSSLQPQPVAGDVLIPFGGHDMVLLGDWLQIPAIGETIPKWIFMHLIKPTKIKSPKDDLLLEAALLFKKFRRVTLTENQRAKDDPSHIQHILRLSDLTKRHPVDHTFINYLKSKQLKLEETNTVNSKWNLEACVLTASNVERAMMNKRRAALYAMIKAEIMIIYPLHSSDASKLDDDELQYALNHYPETTGVFVRGAPAVLTENLQPEKGLSNGTMCYLSGLFFNPKDEGYNDTMETINNAAPGDIVRLSIQPSYIIVEYKPEHGVMIPTEEQVDVTIAIPTHPGHVCVAIPAKAKKTEKITMVIDEHIIPQYHVTTAGVEILFAVTYEKSQGKTLPCVILSLGTNPYSSATLSKMYVGFTRIKHSENLRIWPGTSDQLNLERFLKYVSP